MEEKTGKKDSGIYYWSKMKAIVILNAEKIFFEDVEPGKRVNSEGECNDTFIDYDCYKNETDDTVYIRAFCPYISDKVQLCIPFKEWIAISLDTKKDVFNAFKLISKYYTKAQDIINSYIYKEIEKDNDKERV